VPILPKVTNIGLQILVTCTFYIFCNFLSIQLGRTVFCYHFETIFLQKSCKMA
jgi:hypothetical protein